MIEFTQIAQQVIDGHAENVGRMTRQALEQGAPAQQVLENGLIAGMQEVGNRFRSNQMFLPEVLVSARAMKAGMECLEPIMAACGLPPAGKVIIGTVKGDIHDIGKNLVAVMLRGAGFQVIDLGVDVAAGNFVRAIEQHRPDIIAMSALLTTTMRQMTINIDAFRQKRLLDNTHVLIGGATVTSEWAASIGAAYARDAMAAVTKAKELVRHDLSASRGAS